MTVTSDYGRGTQVRVRIPLQQVSSAVPRSEPLRHSSPPRIYPVLPCSIAGGQRFRSVQPLSSFTTSKLLRRIVLRASLMRRSCWQNSCRATADLRLHLNGALTGLDVLQQVRAATSTAGAGHLLSGDLQAMMRVVKTEIPRCRFLSKPVDTNALLAAISELCGT